jgi:ubiquinol-cytochrome c reductase iron-sulfur subunit
MTTLSATEPPRRDFLYVATAAAAAVGVAAFTWPLISQMNPDASTIAAAAPIS